MANNAEAISAMRNAQQYLEKIAEDSGNRDVRQWLKFAADYAAKARDLDPNATLILPGEDSYVTIDHLTARVLFVEGVLDYGNDNKKAAASLEKALAYYPRGNYYKQLAKTYAQLHRRDDAIKCLEAGLAIEPDSFEMRSMLDKIKANSAIGVKPSIFASHPGLFVGLGVLLGAGGLLYWIVSPIGLFIAVIGGMMFVAGKFSESQKGLLDAIDDLDGQVRNSL